MEVIENILDRLDNVRPSGDRQWMAKCPAHEDERNSLSISLADDGKILLHCHANCRTQDILDALCLPMSSLFPHNGNNNMKLGKIVATYDYVNEDCKLLFQSVRFHPKKFRQRRPVGNGKYKWNLAGVRLVPYRLPEVIAAVKNGKVIYIVEGEKDADNLRAIGLTATTNPMGAGKWRSEYNAYFKGADVVLLPDNDAPGRKHVKDVAAKLYGTPKRIRILELHGLKSKGDVSDFISNGVTMEQIVSLAEKAATWKPPDDSPNTGNDKSSEDILSYERNDRGASSVLKNSFCADVRFNPDRLNSWFLWNGQRWQRDETRAVYEYFDSLIHDIIEKANKSNGETRTQLFRWAAYLSNDRSQNSALAYASKNYHELKIEFSKLDSDPFLLNCLNGSVDLRTGELRPHRRENYITRICPVEYRPGIQSQTWNDFLDTVLPDLDVRRYIQKAAGYSLCGDVSEEKLFFCYGPPATGKSTFLGALQNVLADYAIVTDFTSFLASKMRDTGPRSDIAKLSGYRFVSSIEVEDGQHLAEGLLCMLTGGDKVRSRFLYQESFEYKPTFKIWLAANNRPDVSSGESALWRRLKLLPFDVAIPEVERDPNVKRILQDATLSGAAILSWLVEGFLLWQKEGLRKEPDAVKALTEEYRHESDPLREFLEEKCIVNTADTYMFVGKQELYNAYMEFCNSNKIKYSFSQKTFNKHLAARGLREKQIGQAKTRCWTGIQFSKVTGR